MDILVFHILMAIGLFFLVNWIGKHSYTIGYMSISLFARRDEAPALNLIIRVLSPVVYIIIISSILYFFNLDKYTTNIYQVSILYILIRLLINLLLNRLILINWINQVFQWAVIIFSSYFVYDNIIIEKKNIFPDFTTLSNELWMIILIFIYQIVNKLELSPKGTERRKNKYLVKRYNYFKAKYHSMIREMTNNNMFLEIIVYSILIYEDFNRPRVIRFIENISFKINKRHYSLGVMQVQTNKLINDEESIKLGIEKITKAYDNYLQENQNKETEYFESDLISHIIMDYNNSYQYKCDILELRELIKYNFYK